MSFHFRSPDFQILPESPNKLKFTATGGEVKAKGKGYLRVILIKHPYTAYARAKDIHLSLSTTVSRTKSGKLYIKPGKCTSSLGKVHVDIKGKGLAKLLQFFEKRISKEVKVGAEKM